MKLFEGKTKAERQKIIAAIILCGACLIVLFFAFGRGIFGGSSPATAAKPTPTPRTTAGRTNPGQPAMPSMEDQMREMMALPVVYQPSMYGAPDAGRNIFAFYEPPLPTPYQPTPVPPEPIVTPPPPTPPPIQIAVINPQSVYAGSNGFRLDISGDRFTPETKIYFEQQEIPSSFISETRMTADIPSVLIRNEGRRTILAQTSDGTKTSNVAGFEVQAPPQPQFQYVGMIARARSNNDTAYFQETGKQTPTGARLNDVVGGRFRVVSISSAETILEDVSLGFKHKLPLHSPPPTAATSQPFPGGDRRGTSPRRETFTPVNPEMPSQPATNQRIPGIPDNVPRYVPPSANSNRPQTKDDNDDNDN